MIKNLKSTGDAYRLGTTLTKEQIIKIWTDRKAMNLTPVPEDLQEMGNRGWMSQMMRETVEGFLKNGVIDNSAFTPEEIDSLLGF